MSKDLRASIDIGSNSVLLLIADVTNGDFKELIKRSEITALGLELDKNKVFHQDSMEATFKAIQSYAESCLKYGVTLDKVVATATEASRVAKNSDEFFQRIKDEIGIHIHTITSEAEAYFSAKGILFNSKFDTDVINLMDIGGASTELIKVNTKTFEIMDSISMPIGAVRSAQWLEDGFFVQNLQKVFLDYRNKIDNFQGRELYCVAGTVTSLGNMHLKHKEFVEDDVHGLVLKVEDIDGMFKKYSGTSSEELLEEFPFLQKRSKSIRGGLHLVYHITHRLLVKNLTISTYGLRFGTLLEGHIKNEYLHRK